MKNCEWIPFALLVILVIGCSSQMESSMEEAKFAVQNQSDYQEIIQYFSARSAAALLPIDPYLYKSDPTDFVVLKGTPSIVHGIIYKTKNKTYKLILLDDNRPPRIVASKEF